LQASPARVEQLAERDPQFARELREVAFQSLSRSRDQLVILGGITAIDKVGSFLLSLAGRASETKGQVELPVSRYDIADYLAVSVMERQTVSTALTGGGALKGYFGRANGSSLRRRSFSSFSDMPVPTRPA
jgi:CRP-like cAMP-binding protein